MQTIEKNVTSKFPSIDYIQELAALCGITEEFHPLFYDIETTGLSKKSTQVYLIGVIFYENQDWILKQWFAETLDEESSLLNAFCSFSLSFTHTIQFNGTHFDAPYLRERCSLYRLESPIDTLPALDLYQYLKPMKLLLQFNHLRQADVEAFLSLPERIYPDGKTCIKHYKNYLVSSDQEDLSICLGHNEEDLLGMGKIYKMLNYQGLMDGHWTYEKLTYDSEQCIFQIHLNYPLPVPVSGSIPGLYFRAEENNMRILVYIKNGKLKQYYLNYKDYDYLPAEDTAIHKTLGTYIDKSLKKPASLETCYTWFPVTETFLSDTSQQLQYLKHTVPYILKLLSK